MENLAIDTTRTWTAEEYLQLEENPNQQLINGHLIMSSLKIYLFGHPLFNNNNLRISLLVTNQFK